jgi:hypothetical protein
VNGGTRRTPGYRPQPILPILADMKYLASQMMAYLTAGETRRNPLPTASFFIS